MTDQVRSPITSPTEARNPGTSELDEWSTESILRAINDEDARVPAAVRGCLPELTRLVDEAAARYRAGATIRYVGAGTSGRVAVQDAAELPPTFDVGPDRVVAQHAGQAAAVEHAREAAEDDRDQARRDAAAIREGDVVIGLAASGRTPYVITTLQEAIERTALTALVTSNPRTEAPRGLNHLIVADTGPEVVAGSTRMKAATAQKLILHSFSTALMVRVGRVHSNLMVHMRASNSKLAQRAVWMLGELTGRDRSRCEAALQAADGETPVALLTLIDGRSPEECRRLLEAADGDVRRALADAASTATTDPSLRPTTPDRSSN